VSANNALARFARLLALVPFLQTHQGIAIADAAKIMGITERELTADLNLLWVCGLPGYSHLELIDLDFEQGYISIHNAETLAKPLSLTTDEAVSLLMGLSLLSALPDGEVNEALQSAQAKIRAGAVQAAELAEIAERVAFVPEIPSPEVAQHFKAIEAALLNDKQIDIEYYVPSRDETTRRVIDPLRLRLIDGVSYIDAWCARADGQRLFRIDRIVSAKPLSSSRTHSHSEAIDLPSVEVLPENRISLLPSGRWVLERFGAKIVYDDESGRVEALIPVWDRTWLLRLALMAGGDLQVLDDEGLALQIKTMARQALANYGSGTDELKHQLG